MRKPVCLFHWDLFSLFWNNVYYSHIIIHIEIKLYELSESILFTFRNYECIHLHQRSAKDWSQDVSCGLINITDRQVVRLSDQSWQNESHRWPFKGKWHSSLAVKRKYPKWFHPSNFKNKVTNASPGEKRRHIIFHIQYIPWVCILFMPLRVRWWLVNIRRVSRGYSNVDESIGMCMPIKNIRYNTKQHNANNSMSVLRASNTR